MCLGRGAHQAKLNIKHTFRLCPVRPQDQNLLGMQWQGKYYFDRVLPFGLHSAPSIFNCLAQTVEWKAKRWSTQAIHHYLDDILVMGIVHTSEYSAALHTLTAICQALGIPLSEEKLEGPAQSSNSWASFLTPPTWKPGCQRTSWKICTDPSTTGQHVRGALNANFSP